MFISNFSLILSESPYHSAFVCHSIMYMRSDKTVLSNWNISYQGEIYKYDINPYGSYTGKIISVGYADGHGNYYISGYEVAPNQTLLIESGIIIHIEDGSIVVWGSIQAVGTESEPIVFTSNASEPEWDDWNGIEIKEDYPGESTFEHCTIEYCRKLVCNRNITVDHCTFYKTMGIDVWSIHEPISSIQVTNCTITGNATKGDLNMGLSVGGAPSVIVNDNYVYDKYSTVSASSSGYLEFCRNTVIGGKYWTSARNSGDKTGIVYDNKIFNGSSNFNGNVIVERNEVHGQVLIDFQSLPVSNKNNLFDAYLGYFSADSQTAPLDVRYNQWGRDWYVEELFGWDDWGKGVEILFEPYYDKNGTLTDTDGIPNGWEHNYSLDIYTNDSGEDSDGDSLTNLQEWQLGGNYTSGGTDPKNPDTDGDQLPDGWEIKYGFDPIAKNESKLDTDKDGWTNIEEFKTGTDPNDPLNHPTKIENENYTTIIIITVITGILLLIIFTVVVAMIIRRRKGKEANKHDKERPVEAKVLNDK